MQTVLLFFILFSTGVLLLYLGVSGYLGYRRRSYIQWYYYGYVTGGINYGSIPLGIMSIMWAFIFTVSFPEDFFWFLFYMSAVIGMIGILFGVFQPKFMLPRWYRWLEINHSDIMPYLEKDVRQRGYKTWQRQTKTQEGLEAWVAEVRKKNHL